VTQGYHFAFLIVSTALLGIGSAGAYLAIHLRFYPLEPRRVVVFAPFMFGLMTVSAYLALSWIPFDVVKLAWEPRQLVYFLLAYLILGVPFFFSGLTVVSALLIKDRPIGKVYFSDLGGAATGAFLPIVFFPLGGGSGAIIAVAVLGTLGGILLWIEAQDRKLRRPGLIFVILAGMILLSYILFPNQFAVKLSPYRGLRMALQYPEANLLQTRWNAISRIDVVQSPMARFAPGLSLTFPGRLPPQLGLAIDGDQLHAITAYDGTNRGLSFLGYLPSATPYTISQPKRVFIANPGGGLDVLMALYFGAKRVDVSERNPLIPALVSNPGDGFRNVIYKDPRVHVSIGHERSILQSSGERYDLLVISQLQALAAGAGSPGFAEDYTLTVEAFIDYYRHLSNEGLLTITRYLEPQPVYAVRLLATAIEALEKEGVETPEDHLVVIRSWGTVSVLVKRGKLSGTEIRSLRDFSNSRWFDLDYYPGIQLAEVNQYNRMPEPIYYQIINRLLDPAARVELYRTYPFNIQPVVDDRPFFTYVLRLDRIKEIYFLVHEKWLFLVEGGLLLPVLLIQSILVAGLLILLPTWFRMRTTLVGTEWARNRVFLYFSCIALGFMGIEIAMIQRLILYLVNPVYAISAVLASVLLFAGLGSMLTTFWKAQARFIQVLILLGLCLLILTEASLIPWILNNYLGIPLSGRFAVAVLLLAPLSMLMGMPFPLGMERLKRSGQQTPLAWAWAINGSTSVVAAIFSAFLALYVGITGIFIMAAVSYGIAGWVARQPWFGTDR
jgi:hypothetical protein